MKQFAEQLRDWLDRRSYNWKSVEELWDGCETCNYGATEVETIDGDALWKEIDAFCASFEKEDK